ncbi:MAG: DsbE family thiol:disulfide interchange protein [Proteobacteria bacterium]|nr:DsbE family thiol:disulfide interchange protein [Pseudomonadota bacterium]
MKRIAPFIPLIALALIVVISAALLLRGGGPAPTITAGEVGRPAPTYALARLGGGALLQSDDVRGRVHLINMFASWCVPCRAEHPQLMALHSQGVQIIGVAYKDQPSETTAFLNELGNPFEAVGLDPDGRFGLQLGIAGVPETFVVSADGRIRAAHRGPLTPDIVQREILPALAAR